MSSLVQKAEAPEKRAVVGKCWGYGVVGEGYQPRLGPEGRFPRGGSFNLCLEEPVRVSKVEGERREFHAEETGRQKLRGKRNLTSLSLGASITANTQGGLREPGDMGERMGRISKESRTEEHSDLKVGWRGQDGKVVSTGPMMSLHMVEGGSWKDGKVVLGAGGNPEGEQG